ncbi:hypothetical protein [Xylocopilactobacillus apicola]|uniref:Phr family secreted Rap phosphatase inhibitor n=1 Tax=Xylocopilactobacillus apicola TaxID=2932184 RepID=A0AAU9D2L9_9LACO|nr:hypothetical protein [Xylocopilactobacillus apicola]BDR57969.1 hypothetical protein XA3_04100 [Xylocopilactobacillus apicola]
MKIFKKLSYILIALSGICVLTFALNFKQNSRAADFPHNLTNENNGSDFRGGGI